MSREMKRRRRIDEMIKGGVVVTSRSRNAWSRWKTKTMKRGKRERRIIKKNRK